MKSEHTLADYDERIKKAQAAKRKFLRDKKKREADARSRLDAVYVDRLMGALHDDNSKNANAARNVLRAVLGVLSKSSDVNDRRASMMRFDDYHGFVIKEGAWDSEDKIVKRKLPDEVKAWLRSTHADKSASTTEENPQPSSTEDTGVSSQEEAHDQYQASHAAN